MSSLIGKLYFKLPNSNRLERIWKIAQLDFKKRYYDSYMGLVWAFLNPAFRICIYYFVFTIIFEIGIENFALYLYSGLITFIFFKELTSTGMTIFERKRYLIESIQFNKIDLFISNAIACSYGFFFNVIVYIILSLVLGISFSSSLLYLPIIYVTIVLLGLGVGIILALIRVYFKDIIHAWNLLSLLLFWACPIFYRGEDIIENWPFLMYLNPMAGVVLNTRPVLLTDGNPDLFYLFYNLGLGILLSIIGVFLVKVISKKFVENV